MQQESLRDRIVGAYMGAAIGDAMGGPVEGMHYKLIQAVHRHVTRLLPYGRMYHTGYTVRPAPGSVTDDTFIRDDFTDFVLAYPDEQDRTVQQLVDHLAQHAQFHRWYGPLADLFRQLAAGEVNWDYAKTFMMGGGAGWWTPFALIHAGDPQGAYEETYRLSGVYRQPFEQNLIASAMAGVAAAMQPNASMESVAETVHHFAGPLARKLLERTRRIAETHRGDWDAYVQAIYAEALVEECTPSLDGPMPPAAQIHDPYRGLSFLWAEQIPLAFGAFVYGQGDFVETMAASVNMGRDADSIATTCGAWIGGLLGLSGIPTGWVETMQRANILDLDLLDQANRLADVAARRAAPSPLSS